MGRAPGWWPTSQLKFKTASAIPGQHCIGPICCFNSPGIIQDGNIGRGKTKDYHAGAAIASGDPRVRAAAATTTATRIGRAGCTSYVGSTTSAATASAAGPAS